MFTFRSICNQQKVRWVVCRYNNNVQQTIKIRRTFETPMEYLLQSLSIAYHESWGQSGLCRVSTTTTATWLKLLGILFRCKSLASKTYKSVIQWVKRTKANYESSHLDICEPLNIQPFWGGTRCPQSASVSCVHAAPIITGHLRLMARCINKCKQMLMSSYLIRLKSNFITIQNRISLSILERGTWYVLMRTLLSRKSTSSLFKKS